MINIRFYQGSLISRVSYARLSICLAMIILNLLPCFILTGVIRLTCQSNKLSLCEEKQTQLKFELHIFARLE